MAKNINVVLSLQDKFTTKMKAARLRTQEFKVALTAAQSVSDKFAGVMGKMESVALTAAEKTAGALTAAAGAAALFAQNSLKAYEEFNKVANNTAGIRNIRAQSEEYRKMTEDVKGWAKAVKGTTYTQAMGAGQYMSLAGWSNDMQKNAGEDILRAALISGEEDTKAVVDAITDSITAFGLKSSDVGRFVDMAAAAQSSTNTNMMQLMQGAVNAAATFGELYSSNSDKLQVAGELMAMQGLLASAGIKGEEGGTAIRSLYTRWVKDGTRREAQKGFEKLGMSPYSGSGALKTPTELLGEMAQRVKGLSEKEKNSALSLIGGSYMSELMVLMNAYNEAGEDGLTAYEKVSEALKNSSGAAERYAEVITSDLAGSLKVLNAEWYNMRVRVGEALSPYAVRGIDYIIERMPVIESFIQRSIEQIPSAIDKVKEIYKESEPYMDKAGELLDKLITNAPTIAKIAGGAYIGMGAFRLGTGIMEGYDVLTDLRRLAGRIGIARSDLAARRGLGRKMSNGLISGKDNITAAEKAIAAQSAAKMSALPTASVGGLAPLAAAAASFVMMIKNSKLLREGLKKLFDDTKPVADRLRAAFEKFKPTLSSIWELTKNIFGVMGDAVGLVLNSFEPFYDLAVSILGPIASEIWGEFCDQLKKIADNTNTFVGYLRNGIEKLNELNGVVKDKTSALKEILYDTFKPLKDALDDIDKLEDKWKFFFSGGAGKVLGENSGEGWYRLGLANDRYKELREENKESAFGQAAARAAYAPLSLVDPFGLGDKAATWAKAAKQAWHLDGNANGTGYFKGGLTRINENGGEIVDLPRGSRIIPADKSRQMARSEKNINVYVNIDNYYGEDKEYVRRIGNEIAEELAKIM